MPGEGGREGGREDKVETGKVDDMEGGVAVFVQGSLQPPKSEGKILRGPVAGVVKDGEEGGRRCEGGGVREKQGRDLTEDLGIHALILQY